MKNIITAAVTALAITGTAAHAQVTEQSLRESGNVLCMALEQTAVLVYYERDNFSRAEFQLLIPEGDTGHVERAVNTVYYGSHQNAVEAARAVGAECRVNVDIEISRVLR